MPKAFDDCVKKGGKVRTKKVGKNSYMKICIINGKTIAGHVEEKKPEKKKRGN